MNVKAEGAGENSGSGKVVLTFPDLLFSLISKDQAPGWTPNWQTLLSSLFALLA